MTEIVIDRRKQRIFAALQDRTYIALDTLAAEADVTKALAARELSRLGWSKRPAPDEAGMVYWRPGYPRRGVPKAR